MANICPCTFGNSVSQALNNLRNVKKLNEQLPEQTAAATVVSRRVDTCYSLEKTASSWAYFVTFRLDTGAQTELKVTEEDYRSMKEGTALRITWKADNLVSFRTEG